MAWKKRDLEFEAIVAGAMGKSARQPTNKGFARNLRMTFFPSSFFAWQRRWLRFSSKVEEEKFRPLVLLVAIEDR